MHLFISPRSVRTRISQVHTERSFFQTHLLSTLLGPRAIVMTSISGLVGGWAVILVIAYTITDVSVRLSSGFARYKLIFKVCGHECLWTAVHIPMFASSGSKCWSCNVGFEYSCSGG